MFGAAGSEQTKPVRALAETAAIRPVQTLDCIDPKPRGFHESSRMKNWTHSLATLGTLAHVNPLTRIERWALGACGLATIGMLLALTSLCQESVQRGERFRAEQRNAASLQATGTQGP
jgi:hypothetical protein